MTALKHPRIPNVEVDVPEPDAARWASQGWVSDEPTEATEATDDKPAYDRAGGYAEGGITPSETLPGPPETVRPKRRK